QWGIRANPPWTRPLGRSRSVGGRVPTLLRHGVTPEFRGARRFGSISSGPFSLTDAAGSLAAAAALFAGGAGVRAGSGAREAGARGGPKSRPFRTRAPAPENPSLNPTHRADGEVSVTSKVQSSSSSEWSV